MKFCILASGSEGNCGLVEDREGYAVLVDAGLSLRRTSESLTALGRDIGKIQGLLVSHEHSDHLRGAAVMARRLDLPIYASEATISLVKRFLPDFTRFHAVNGERHWFGRLQVEAFTVSHDAPETVGFSITEDERRLVIATDLGIVDLLTLDRLRDSDAVVLEANHDLEMLLDGPYPWDLKERIKSHRGHLSNQQAAEALVQVASPRLKRVVLAHLSQENNRPELALNKVQSELHNAGHSHIDVIVADQHCASEMFEV